MIRKIVSKYNLEDPAATKRDLAYWLSRAPAERLAAVDALRKLCCGNSARLQNATRILDALREFGFDSADLTEESFCTPHKVIQLGVLPVRVDLITSLTGVSWEESENSSH